MSSPLDISKNVESFRLGAAELRSTKEQSSVPDKESTTSDEDSNGHGFTKNDHSDMHRMEKRQELLRGFRTFAALSFTVVLQATWEYFFIANTQGLVDGGILQDHTYDVLVSSYKVNLP